MERSAQVFWFLVVACFAIGEAAKCLSGNHCQNREKIAGYENSCCPDDHEYDEKFKTMCSCKQKTTEQSGTTTRSFASLKHRGGQWKGESHASSTGHGVKLETRSTASTTTGISIPCKTGWNNCQDEARKIKESKIYCCRYGYTPIFTHHQCKCNLNS